MAKPMIDLHEKECGACKATFRENLIDTSGRCPECVSNNVFVGGKEKQDYIQENSKKYEELKSLVRQILDELKKEDQEDKDTAFAPKLCKECGKEFVPRAPAAKICDECHTRLKTPKNTDLS